jgi:AcrR family transcriptional regulator
MARQLNPKLREDILYYAKEIMHEEGFDALSMRKVAQKSDMVVGNVYRYFKNKEALIDEVFSPVVDNLDGFINFRFEEIKDEYPTIKDLQNFIQKRGLEFSEQFEDTLEKYYYELQIIISNPGLSREIRNHIVELIKSLIQAYADFDTTHYEELGQHLVNMFSQSIMYGIFDAIEAYPNNKKNLKVIISSYLMIFTKLLETDILDYPINSNNLF